MKQEASSELTFSSERPVDSGGLQSTISLKVELVIMTVVA
jgi:hypothetical protein